MIDLHALELWPGETTVVTPRGGGLLRLALEQVVQVRCTHLRRGVRLCASKARRIRMSAKVSATRDGEPSRVANLFCQVELQERETAPPTDAENAQTVKGAKVLWECESRYIPGTIERVNGDGTYGIKWTYGGAIRDWMRETIESSKRVDKDRIQPAPDTSKWRKKLDDGDKDLRGADLRFEKLTAVGRAVGARQRVTCPPRHLNAHAVVLRKFDSEFGFEKPRQLWVRCTPLSTPPAETPQAPARARARGPPLSRR